MLLATFRYVLSFVSSKRGASRYASQQFPEIVILAGCKNVGRHFVHCYACSIVYFCFFL